VAAGAGDTRAGTCVGTPDTPCTPYTPFTGTPIHLSGTPHRSGTPHLTGTPQPCAPAPWLSPGPAAPEARTFWHRGAEAEAAAAEAAAAEAAAAAAAAAARPGSPGVANEPQQPYQPYQPQLVGMLSKRGASFPWSWKRRAFHYDAASRALSYYDYDYEAAPAALRDPPRGETDSNVAAPPRLPLHLWRSASGAQPLALGLCTLRAVARDCKFGKPYGSWSKWGTNVR